MTSKRHRSRAATITGVSLVVLMAVFPIFEASPAGAATSTAPAVPANSTPTIPSATQLLQDSGGPSTGPIPLTTTSTKSGSTTTAVTPDTISPSGCQLKASGLPHISTSQTPTSVKVLESTSCTLPVSTLYIQVSLYKDDFGGTYYENTGSNTNTDSTYVAASTFVNCSNTTQSTTFFGISYTYDIEPTGVYSAEGSSANTVPPLKCGTPGGGG